MVILFLFFLTVINCDLPPFQRVQEWANSFGTFLEDDFKTASGYDLLKNSYSERSSDVELDRVDVEAFLDSATDAFSQLFAKRIEALEALVTAAESSTLTHVHRDKLQLLDVLTLTDTVLMSRLEAEAATDDAEDGEQAPLLTYDPVVSRQVNWSLAGVHTPLEVYEGYNDVLNALIWSQSVDGAARLNRLRDPDLRWQYIASHLGFLRLYPATWWPTPTPLTGDADLFDARRRPWYLTAAASPRHVLMIMDISGSVYGQTFEIMKVAVRSAINTLTDRDYFNVIWSASNTGWVNRCLTGLVPASLANKRRISVAVANRTAANISNWALGLEMAYSSFQKFYESDEPYPETGCNKMIMFFTDGGTEWPGRVINKYRKQPHTKDVRIFTYALGPHPVPSHLLKKMACENGGTFTTIFASGAVRTAIQASFQSALAETMADSSDIRPSFTTTYLDVGDLGPVISVSKPIFNRSEAAERDRLLGVAGVDISLTELLAAVGSNGPGARILAPFGYLFAVNNRGVVMFHPQLKQPIHYSQDAPDVELLELEGDDAAIREVRDQMVSGAAGFRRREQQLVMMEEDRQLLAVPDVEYTYRPIANTPFSIAVVLPGHHAHLSVIENTPAGEMLIGDGTTLASSVDCCRNYSLDASTQPPHSCCDSRMYQHLKWDLQLTEAVITSWLQSPAPDGVVVRFVSTGSGLVRYFPSDVSLNMSRFSVDGSLFLQATNTDQLTVRSVDERHLVVARRITISTTRVASHTVAVLGVVYDADWLHAALNGDSTLSVSFYDRLCQRSDRYNCWLMDDSAQLLPSSGDYFGSQFIGHTEPQLMWQLINSSVFTQHVRRDQMGVCGKRVKATDVSAAPCHQHLWHLPLSLMQSLTGYLQQIRHLIFAILTAWQTGVASSLDEFGFEANANERSCTLVSGFYRLAGSDHANHEGQLTANCDNMTVCDRSYKVALIPGTNLAVVVIDPACECPLEFPRLPYEPVENDELAATTCYDSFKPLFRRNIEQCFSRSTNVSMCSGSDRRSIQSLIVTLPLLSLGVALYWR